MQDSKSTKHNRDEGYNNFTELEKRTYIYFSMIKASDKPTTEAEMKLLIKLLKAYDSNVKVVIATVQKIVDIYAKQSLWDKSNYLVILSNEFKDKYTKTIDRLDISNDLGELMLSSGSPTVKHLNLLSKYRVEKLDWE